MSGEVWDRSSFSKNRERLVLGEIADRFFSEIVKLASAKKLVSSEHFTVDGTVVHAWASLKSFQKKSDKKDRKSKKDPDDRNPEIDFKGEKRSNETHESKTDPEAKLYTKSKAETSKMSYMGHVLMENRNGLAVDSRFSVPGYHEEPQAAFEMAHGIADGDHKTLGADKHYDQGYLTEELKGLNVSSHTAQNIHARKHTSSIDGRTTRHESYEISQRKRKRVKEIFGWLKTIGLMRRPMLRGKERMARMFTFALGVYNLVRIKNLCA